MGVGLRSIFHPKLKTLLHYYRIRVALGILLSGDHYKPPPPHRPPPPVRPQLPHSVDIGGNIEKARGGGGEGSRDVEGQTP